MTVPNPDLWSDSTSWVVNADDLMVSPTKELLHLNNEHSLHRSEYSQNDTRIRFKFAATYDSDPAKVHKSKLHFIGGRLAELAATQNDIYLDEDCSPDLFALLKKFFYLCPFSLNDKPVGQVLTLIKIAHTWELNDCCSCLCRAIQTSDLLRTAREVLEAQHIAVLPGLPRPFKIYFWHRVASCFDDFGSTSSPNAISAGFPDLWDLALSEGMLYRVMNEIVLRSNQNVSRSFLRVILEHLEPKLNESTVYQLLFSLNPGFQDCMAMLEGNGVPTTRAITIFSKFLLKQPRHARGARERRKKSSKRARVITTDSSVEED